ncbi:hypothetical protein [Sulfolobus spindle-shaped virus]|nr:hypothetical protein [Sulfolobus spindle-shaped virus]AZG03597.1 hypothetical protein [Sulfolobus spindle-shaped virus]AZG03630.1 hypothetical protein [Sulfolobus spindle-shaped virus]AZG03696.1 hypothetical protein [Sulfolobus spindle-shaped virus]AZG03699.1 hypothetical protein [Sulfolobus spindle-shaped virus]
MAVQSAGLNPAPMGVHRYPIGYLNPGTPSKRGCM